MCFGSAVLISQLVWATLFWSRNHQVRNNTNDDPETEMQSALSDKSSGSYLLGDGFLLQQHGGMPQLTIQVFYF